MALEDWERIPDREVMCPPFTGGLPWDGRTPGSDDARIVSLYAAIRLNPDHAHVGVWRDGLATLLRRRWTLWG